MIIILHCATKLRRPKFFIKYDHICVVLHLCSHLCADAIKNQLPKISIFSDNDYQGAYRVTGYTIHTYTSPVSVPCCQGAEDALRKETGFFESVSGAGGSGQGSSDVSSVLSVYKSEGDPEAYTSNYISLKVFVEKSLDIYKVRVCVLELYAAAPLTVVCNVSGIFGRSMCDVCLCGLHQLLLPVTACV